MPITGLAQFMQQSLLLCGWDFKYGSCWKAKTFYPQKVSTSINSTSIYRRCCMPDPGTISAAIAAASAGVDLINKLADKVIPMNSYQIWEKVYPERNASPDPIVNAKV